MNGTVVDVFGEIAVDGTGQPWEHLDGWTYRVNDTGADGSTFVLANWTFSGPNALDGETTNATATSAATGTTKKANSPISQPSSPSRSIEPSRLPGARRNSAFGVGPFDPTRG